MKRQPMRYTAIEIKEWNVDRECKDGSWKPDRPYGCNLFPWSWRWRLAFLVLIGRFDALSWED